MLHETPFATPLTTITETIHPKDEVLFYRGFGHYSPSGRCWHLEIQGRVYAPYRKLFRKSALLHLIQRFSGVRRNTEGHERFLERANLFLNANRSGQSVPISIAEKAYSLPSTSKEGHFHTTITLPETALESVIEVDAYGRRFVNFSAQLSEEDDRIVRGDLELIPPDGFSVISDVDDTIKVSNVSDRRELLANTFTRAFRSVPGMSALYKNWAQQGVSFHYVSASPWPLYRPLGEWLDSDEFPIGSVHLRHVRLRDLRKDPNRDKAFRNKRASIERILRCFPERKFMMVGDSGERDAELYSVIASNFGPQIRKVFIRDIGPDRNGNRPEQFLSRLPQSQWTLFKKPEEIQQHAVEPTLIVEN